MIDSDFFAVSDCPMVSDRAEYFKAYREANVEKLRAAHHAYYVRNKERVIANSIERRRRNREHYNALDRERRKKNPEPSRMACRKWAAAHYEQELERCRKKQKLRYREKKEQLLAQNREYHEANKEKIAAQQREYYKRNATKRNAACRQYHRMKRATDPAFRLNQSLRGKENYQANKDRIQARHKEWMSKHPGYARSYSHLRRAKKRAVTIKPESIGEWMERIRSKRLATCHYCGTRISSKSIHFDHIKALAKGGEHRIENLCVSCPKCNLTKGAAELSEWCKQGQQMLALLT